jgi:hypothetical protein
MGEIMTQLIAPSQQHILRLDIAVGEALIMREL